MSIFKGPLTRSLLFSFAALAFVTLAMSIASVWSVISVQRSLAQVNLRSDFASLSARVRAETLVMTSMVQQAVRQPENTQALRSQFTGQSQTIDRLVHQSIASTPLDDSRQLLQIQTIDAQLEAYIREAGVIIDTVSASGATDILERRLDLLINDYQAPLLRTLATFEQSELEKVRAAQALSDTMIRWAIVVQVGAVLIGLLAVGVMAGVLLRHVARPLAALQTGVENIAAGRLDLPVEVQTNNELGDLSAAINRMAAELQESHRRLANYAYTLECEVAERTHEAEQRAEQAAGLSEMLQTRADELEKLAVQAQAAAEVAQATGSILALEELLQRCVSLIQSRFNMYYVGLFLVAEDGDYAELRAAAGHGSTQLLSERQTLQLNSSSMITWVIIHATSRLAPDVRQEPIRFQNPLLPNSGSEIALPLITRGEVIGAITVQSETVDAFSPSAVTILETMAGQIANAIGNAQLYQALEQEKQTAEAANRTKSVFLANMSHEIRTPLNAILGFTGFLQFDSTLTAEQREHVAIIHRNSQGLLTLINGILDLSKIEAGRMTLNQQVFSFQSLFKSLEELLSLQAIEKDLELVFEVAPGLPAVVFGDEVKIRQVLVHLLSNALKFTEQGWVVLRVRQAEPEEYDDTPAPQYEAPVYLHFSVEDTGPGIRPQDAEQIFNPFSHTTPGRSPNQGAGLGLAISRQFVRLMGGDLVAVSLPGKGARFSFVVPLGQESALRARPMEPLKIASLAPDQTPPRLLVVDDHQENRKWLVWLLAMMGFEVRQASNAEEALQIWRFWRPQLIFMEMGMQPVDGYTVVRQIKAFSEAQPARIIAMLPAAWPVDPQEALVAGCEDVLSQPVEMEAILQLLQKHLSVRFEVESIPETIVSGHLAAKYTQRARFNLISLAPDWVEKLRQAALVADFDVIAQLIDQIRAHQPELSEYLTRLANNYDVRGLLDLLPAEDEISHPADGIVEGNLHSNDLQPS